MDEYNDFYSFSDSLFSSKTYNNYSEVSLPQHLRHDVNQSITNNFTSPFDISTILSERRTPNLTPTATITSPSEIIRKTPTSEISKNPSIWPRVKNTPPRSLREPLHSSSSDTPVKQRCEWGDRESFELISAWGPRYERFKGGSSKAKKVLWNEIYDEYKQNVQQEKN